MYACIGFFPLWMARTGVLAIHSICCPGMNRKLPAGPRLSACIGLTKKTDLWSIIASDKTGKKKLRGYYGVTHDTKATTDGHETCSVWSFGDTSAVLAMFFQHHWVLGFGERCGGGFRTCSWGPSWESRSELVVLSDDKVNGCPPSSMIYRCLRQFKNLIFPSLNGYLMLFAICRMPDVQTLRARRSRQVVANARRMAQMSGPQTLTAADALAPAGAPGWRCRKWRKHGKPARRTVIHKGLKNGWE